MSKDDAMHKIKEQLGEAKVSNNDPTKTLTKKFQSVLSAMRKQDKLSNSQFYEMYPSDAVAPRMYGMLKAHKPQKNYPMRLVVSTIGSPMYGVSKYLVGLIQPVLDKNETRLKNSSTFVEKAKNWSIAHDETQVSFDVIALYPSVPIKKAIDVIMNIIQNDWESVQQKTKLTVTDIKKLLDLCLHTCYFMWENECYTIEDSGPIGLSLMVVIAEGYLQFIEHAAMTNAINNRCAPKSFYRYVDDSHARFDKVEDVDRFLVELNSQDPKIQYTVEREERGQLAFLDVSITNNKKGSYDFNIFRKDAITNVQIKPNSSINPTTISGVFKGFLVRATRICSTQFLQDELNFLINVFVENGHDRCRLQKIADDHLKASSSCGQNEQLKNSVKIPWIPKIGPKLRKIYRSNGINVVFTSTPSLSEILCNHKCPMPANSRPGVYKIDCKCGGAAYVGETKKQVSTRVIEHERDVFHGRWEKSGLTEHSKDCIQAFDFASARTLATESNYRRRKIREALEIRRNETAPRMTLATNKDRGNVLKSETWNFLLPMIGNN